MNVFSYYFQLLYNYCFLQRGGDPLQLSPYVRFAIDQHIDASWHLEERIIFDYELLYIKEGKLRITVEDTVYKAGPGDVFLFRPNRRHSMQPLSPQGFRQPHLHFDLVWQEDSEQVFISYKPLEQMSPEEQKMIRPDILSESDIPLPDKLEITDINMFEQLLFEVIFEFETQLPYAQLSTQGAFLRLWTFILRQQLLQGNIKNEPQSTLMLEIRHLLNTSTGQTVSLDELSSRFNISKYHLVRSFKKLFGMSPIQYHQRCRLEKAKNMVLYTMFPMTQIASELGFENPSTFTRAFKNQYQQSPSQLRRTITGTFTV